MVPHLEFLRLLNDISNAYKHSFVNSELMLVGRDEPGVYALELKWNDLANQTTRFSASPALRERDPVVGAPARVGRPLQKQCARARPRGVYC